MALKVADRVKQLTTSTGTGDISFSATPTGFISFSSVLTNGDTTYYCIEENDKWEVGVGIYGSDNMVRSYILASSNGGNAINLGGSGTVFITYPAGRSVYQDEESQTVIGSSGIVFSNGTVVKEAKITELTDVDSSGTILSGNLLSFDSTHQGLLIGDRTGPSNDNNTLIGYGAASGTTGTDNTVLGTNAFTAGNGGIQSVSIGSFAGPSEPSFSSSSSYSVSIGYKAGSRMRSNSTAIGYQAGIAAYEEGFVAIGASAGSGIGSFSVAVGKDAANGSTSNYIVAVGHQAGKDAGGDNSVWIGDMAGLSCSSSSKSVGIGYQAGKNSSGSNSIYIGKDAGHSSTETNYLYIGNGTPSSSRTLIKGDMQSKRLAVGAADVTLEDTLYVGVASSVDTGLVVRGAASQTANLQEWQDFAGGIQAKIASSGILGANGVHVSGEGVTIDSSVPTNTTNALYSIGGTLYWNLSPVGVPTGVPTEVSFYDGLGRLVSDPAFIFDSGSLVLTAGSTSIGDRVAINESSSRVRVGRYVGDDGITDSNFVSTFGYQAATNASGANNSFIAGYYTAYNSIDLSYSQVIGSFAGLFASGEKNTYVGEYAGAYSSGTYNTFIGHQAGRYCKGSQNIEILASGAVNSVIDNHSNKLHIGNTIIGDTSNKKLAIGNVSASNVTPDATLEILPKNSTDIGVIVQGAVSQSANLQEWQASNAVPVVQVSAEGNVSASGSISASGAFLIDPLVPSVTTNKLYNDGGTLKFNGSVVGADDDTYVSGIAVYASGQSIDNEADLVYVSGIAAYASGMDLNGLGDVSYGETNLTNTLLINNVAGSSPLHGTLTGNNENNIGIGYYALGSITDADTNVALGYFANRFLTTGYNNVSIGGSAGEQMTTGYRNIQIGQMAHQYANDGAWNIAIGQEALRGNSDGTSTTENYNNIAIGHQALNKIETGDSNTAVGDHAGEAVTTGSQNVLLGRYAGDDVTTESQMLYIGYQATSSNGTFIKGDMLNRHLAIGMADTNFVNSAGSPTLQVYPANAADEAIFAKMAASHSANLIQIQDSSGADLFVVNSAGEITTGSISDNDAYVSGVAVYASGQAIENETDISYVSGIAVYASGNSGGGGGDVTTAQLNYVSGVAVYASGQLYNDTYVSGIAVYSSGQAIANESDIATNTSNISTNTARVAYASGQAIENEGLATYASGQAIENEAAIATNVSNISTNTSNISTNTGRVNYASGLAITNELNVAYASGQAIENETAIATNTSNISTNTSNISTNSGRITYASGQAIENEGDLVAVSGIAAYASGEANTYTAGSGLTLVGNEFNIHGGTGNFEKLEIKPSTTTNVGLTVQSAVSQSVNLQEWQNSSQNTLSHIDTSGVFTKIIGSAGTDVLRIQYGDKENNQTIASNTDIKGVWLDFEDGSEYTAGTVNGNALLIGTWYNTAKTIPSRIKIGATSFNVSLANSQKIDVQGTTSKFNTDVLPFSAMARDLGSASLPWNNMYVSGIVASGVQLASHVPANTTNTLYNEGGTLKFNGSAVGGGDVSTAQLNYVSGIAVYGSGQVNVTTEGTAEASKALVLDSAKSFTGVKDGRFSEFDSFVYSTGVSVGNSGVLLSRNTPDVTTDTLYNVGGTLYFNGSQLASAGGASAEAQYASGQAIQNETDIAYVSGAAAYASGNTITTQAIANYASGQAIANETDIATNTSNISTNTTNIATNTSRVAYASGQAIDNETDIAYVSGVATYASGQAIENEGLATYASGQAIENETAIATNTSNISTNTSNISTNTARVNYASGQAIQNETDIAYTSGIATYASGNTIVNDGLIAYASGQAITNEDDIIATSGIANYASGLAITNELNVGYASGQAIENEGLATYASGQAIDNETDLVYVSGAATYASGQLISTQSVDFTAGDGLTGGGTLASDRTFAVGAGSLIDVQADQVDVDLTEAAAATIAHGDNLIFLDGGAAGAASKGSTDDLAALLAGDGLTKSNSVMAVNVDDSTIETNSDAIRVKDNGITLAKMAGLARGKIIYGDSNGDPAALALGGANQVLTSDGTDVTWADNVNTYLSGVAAYSSGNTIVNDGLVAYASGNTANIAFGSNAEGDLLYHNGTSFVRLARGADDTVLKMNGNVPNWEADSGGGGGMTNFTLAGDGGSNQTIADGNTLTVAGGNGITTTGAATDTVSIAVDAAQTTITSLLATDIKIGEDNETKIDFEDANAINFYADNHKLIALTDANDGDAVLTVPTADKNFTIKGTDGSSAVTALDIDMAEGGLADFSDNIRLQNHKFIVGQQTGGADRNILGLDDANEVQLGNNNVATNVKGSSITIADATTVNGVLDITDTTDSSDATGDTGALRCEGGASIAKKLYVGTDFDVDGTTNLDAVDIDGNVQIDGTVTVGVDDTGKDVKFYGATSGSYLEWDESVDTLNLVGAAYVQEAVPANDTPTAEDATVTLDLRKGNFHNISLGQNVTKFEFTNAKRGQRFILRITQNASSAKSVSWSNVDSDSSNTSATIRWASNRVPTMSTSTSHTDVYGFLCTNNAGTAFDGFIIGQDLPD